MLHDNIIRGCQSGIVATTAAGSVGEVIDARTFRSAGGLPWPRRRTHRYQGWRVAWTSGRNALRGPKIAEFDADECLFRLAEDADLRPGARFELYCPQGLHWNIHHNVLTNCRQPVRLDVFGGPTAVFADNQLSRGRVDDVKVAAEISGIFKITDNQFAGFDGPDSVALLLHPDRFGKPPRLICRDNLFDACTAPIGEGGESVWPAVIKGGNVFGDKVEASTRDNAAVAVQTRTPEKREASVLEAVRTMAPPTVDGGLDDWSWAHEAPRARLKRSHQGAPVSGWSAQCRAVYDKEALYFAVRVNLPGKAEAGAADKVEWSFRSIDVEQSTPIFVLIGSADGTVRSLTAMGATADQAAKVQEQSTYKAKQAQGGWDCEWRVPWEALGVSPTNLPRNWRMNLGVAAGAGGSWLAWVPTGGRICDVDMAGELRLGE